MINECSQPAILDANLDRTLPRSSGSALASRRSGSPHTTRNSTVSPHTRCRQQTATIHLADHSTWRTRSSSCHGAEGAQERMACGSRRTAKYGALRIAFKKSAGDLGPDSLGGIKIEAGTSAGHKKSRRAAGATKNISRVPCEHRPACRVHCITPTRESG